MIEINGEHNQFFSIPTVIESIGFHLPILNGIDNIRLFIDKRYFPQTYLSFISKSQIYSFDVQFVCASDYTGRMNNRLKNNDFSLCILKIQIKQKNIPSFGSQPLIHINRSRAQEKVCRILVQPTNAYLKIIRAFHRLPTFVQRTVKIIM